MKKLLFGLIAITVLSIISCSKFVSQYDKIDNAEEMMKHNTDSALSILESIEPSDIKVDSLRAKLIFLRAYGHMKQNRSMIADSLISFAHTYYKGKEINKNIRSGNAFAWYKFWVGDTPGAISMLDSLAGISNVPDTIMAETLRLRVLLGASEYQGRQIIPLAKRLLNLETDSMRIIEAKYMLLAGYEYAGEPDSAIHIINELIDFAAKKHWGDKHFLFELERAQLLTEKGKNAESDSLIRELFRKAGPDNGAADILHLQHAVNAINTGNMSKASRHLALTDSFASILKRDDVDNAAFHSYNNLLRTIIDFKQTGRISLIHIAALNNRQIERFNRMKASQWESERGALLQQSRALALKAESRQKTVIILIVILLALLILGGASWIIIVRRQRERENEERIEALQKMVDEYKSAPAKQESELTKSSALRNAMLKQLGIIKMVAETPTEQNREMLRKISSIDGDTNGELVDWKVVFEIIDNLYSDFYKNLHAKYGDVITQKEEQIIVLMVAGFSTKEISVITGQTTSTIYVRKSSIRKKLGVPEKEDIVRFLLSHSDD